MTNQDSSGSLGGAFWQWHQQDAHQLSGYPCDRQVAVLASGLQMGTCALRSWSGPARGVGGAGEPLASVLDVTQGSPQRAWPWGGGGVGGTGTRSGQMLPLSSFSTPPPPPESGEPGLRERADCRVTICHCHTLGCLLATWTPAGLHLNLGWLLLGCAIIRGALMMEAQGSVSLSTQRRWSPSLCVHTEPRALC